MRRDGILTGYLWNRTSLGKVKVKGKATNASKASARCSRAKCSSCHQQPVSKAKAKTKGRNKRALSRLVVDDEWAYCQRSPACRHRHAIKVVPSHPQFYPNDCYTYDALDACDSDAELSVDDDFDVSDAFHAEVNPMALQVHDKDLDAADANDDLNMSDHYVSMAVDVSNAGTHGHDEVKDVGMLMSAAVQDEAEEYVMHSVCVFGVDGNLYTVTHSSPPVRRLLAVAPDVNSGICAKAIDAIIDGDVYNGCHVTMAHAEDDAILEEEAENDDANDNNANAMIVHAAEDLSVDDANDNNANANAMIVHAAEDLSDDDAADNDDDDVHGGDEAANEFQSLISGLVNVGLPTHDSNEEVLEVECEENGLSGDWCYVASPADVDDWCLC